MKLPAAIKYCAEISVRFFLAMLIFHPTIRASDTNGARMESAPRFRIAFSIGVLGELNRNDANASIMAWGKALLDLRQVAADAHSTVFDRTEDLFSAVQNGQIDGAAVKTDEFFSRPPALEPEAVYLGLRNGKTTEQYILLVHRKSGIEDLDALKGHSLLLHKSARTCLAAPWLDICLARRGLGPPESIFIKIERPEKVSRAILRVFFRQDDACVVTRAAFEMMCELNPQLRKELRLLAASPEVVPSVFFFRPGFTGRLREDVEASIASMQETVPGRQTLTIFQGDNLGKFPLSSLDSALALIEEQARLRGALETIQKTGIQPGLGKN
jgi:phosphonate transport system substrate-binding protein